MLILQVGTLYGFLRFLYVSTTIFANFMAFSGLWTKLLDFNYFLMRQPSEVFGCMLKQLGGNFLNDQYSGLGALNMSTSTGEVAGEQYILRICSALKYDVFGVNEVKGSRVGNNNNTVFAGQS